MAEETITFVGAAGHRLTGRLHRPDGPVAGSVLFAHCFTCSKDLHTTTRLARALSAAGYAVLRFDFTGLGESGGTMEHTTVGTNVGDVRRAAVAMIERGLAPSVLIGHSLGGAAVILAAKSIKTITAVAVLAAPSDVRHVTHLFADHVDTIQSDGCAVVSIAGRSFPIGAGFVESLQDHDVLAAASDLGVPFLVVHGPDDRVVGFENGRELHAAASEPKHLLSVDGADHLFSDPAVAARVASSLVAWLAEVRRTRSDAPPAGSTNHAITMP